MNHVRKDGGRKRPRRGRAPFPALAPGTMEKLFPRDPFPGGFPGVRGVITNITEPEPDITVRDLPLDYVNINKRGEGPPQVELHWETPGMKVRFEAPLAVVEEHLRPLLLHALAGTLPEKKAATEIPAAPAQEA